jgi:hypothetical protein
MVRNKYSNAEEIMEKQVDAMEAYCNRVEKAGNAEDITKNSGCIVFLPSTLPFSNLV